MSRHHAKSLRGKGSCSALEPRDLACPVCGARNMDVQMFDRPVSVEFDDDGNQKFCTGTYCCRVCSKDGMITFVKKAKSDDTRKSSSS